MVAEALASARPSLDTSVRDTMLLFQAIRGLSDQLCRNSAFEWAIAFDQLLQINAVDEFHHDVVNVAFVIDVVGDHDVGMVQLGNRFGFHRQYVGNVV